MFFISQTLIFNSMRDSPDDCESGYKSISLKKKNQARPLSVSVRPTLYICINENDVQQPKNNRDLYHHYCIMTKF